MARVNRASVIIGLFDGVLLRSHRVSVLRYFLIWISDYASDGRIRSSVLFDKALPYPVLAHSLL
jgi:hypothetical protein